jgi:hypothetical protein
MLMRLCLLVIETEHVALLSPLWSDMRHSRLFNLFSRVYLKLSSQIQFSNSILKLSSLSGLRPRPHARRGFSLRSSLLGASGFIQPTTVIMRHAKQSAPERPLKVSIYLYRSGARFCSKGRRITLLSSAARMPTKGKAAQPYFKSSGARAPLINTLVLGFGFLRRTTSCIHAVVRVSPVTL